jgi:hypothetical protein
MEDKITIFLVIARCFKVAINELAAVESSPEVGSSRSRIRGLVSSSVPMLHRFLSPPETSEIGVSAHFSKFRRRRIAETSSILRSLDHASGSLDKNEKDIQKLNMTKVNTLA